jgi:DNA topoisomerase-3
LSYLFIAEKPAMGRDIAKARATMLGVQQQAGTGFIKVGPDTITWVMGHMYELQPPEYYDPKWKQWRIEDLPILPPRFERRASQADYQVRQLKIIRELLKTADQVVNVGDAGREGQLLIDELLQEMKWDPFGDKTKRLWIQSLSEKDIIAGMGKIFPNKDKIPLYEAAFQRQIADWVHGLSLTRFYTVKARMAGATSVLTIGRVQTPTLKLVVDRDRAIENFKRVKHYKPSGFFRHANGSFRADWEIPADTQGMDPEGKYLIDKSVADGVAAKIMGKEGKVFSYETTKKRKSAPMPYTLDSLTKACTSKFNMTADEVANVMQKLYEEHKIVSYPRTDCEFLPTTILKEDAASIMTALAGNASTDKAAQNADLRLKSAAWNDSKITDHYGIIPTTNFTPAKYNSLSQDEKNVFGLIAQRFIVQFYPDQEWFSTSVTITIEGYKFKTNGRVPVAAGWTSVYNTSEEGDDPDPEQETDQALPEMRKGDTVIVDRTVINDSTTSPPSGLNDGTLIEMMKYVYKYVTNPEIKKRLKDGGLGTSATRGNIIKGLLDRGYLKRKGKTGLVSTEQGRAIIDAVPEEVSSPEMTAIWEQQLDRVQRGEFDPKLFQEAIRKSVTNLLDRIRNVDIKIRGQTIEPMKGHGDICPGCGKGTLVTRQVTMKKDGTKKRVLSCSASNRDDPSACKYIDWGDGPRVEIEPITGHGKACPECAKKGRPGKMLTRMIGQGDNKGLRFLSCDQWSKDDPKNSCGYSEGLPERPKPSETMEGDGTTCPKCKKGTLRTRQSKTGKVFLACDNWRAGDKKSCDHVVWGEDKVDPIEGHGLKCETCKTGTMITRQTKNGRFLKCSEAPKCEGVIFPDSYSSPKKTGASSSSGGNVNFGNRPKPASPTGGRQMPGKPLNLARPFKK